MFFFRKKGSTSILKQIRSVMIAVSISSLLVFGLIVNSYFLRNQVENYRKDFDITLNAADTTIEIQINRVIGLMRNLLNTSEYMNALSVADQSDELYMPDASMKTIDRFAADIAQGDNLVQEIISFSLDGKMQIHSKMENLSQYALYYSMNGMDQYNWAVAAKEAMGREIVYGNNALTGNPNSISIVKYMIDPGTGTPVGYLAVMMSKKTLSKAFEQVSNYDCSFMILDSNEEDPLVFFSGPDKYREEAEQLYEHRNERSDFVFCEKKSQIEGWTIASFIQRTELIHSKRQFIFVVFLALAILILVAIIASYSIARHIYKPLGELEKAMQRVENGDSYIKEEFDDSDVGLLGQKFKNLVNNNLRLQQQILYDELRRKDMELHVMEDQINPHFLYNTLDALYCLAEIDGNDRIAKMVSALSETFRLSLNNGENLISVRDEVRHIHAFMTIQNMRFNDRFKLHMDLDEVMDEKILKLILEPFVENAVIHGLEPKIGKGQVDVSGKKESDGTLIFTVKDDGVGVQDTTQLEKGFAIANVRNRIQIYYNEGSDVQIQSQKGSGTTVIITIKRRTPDEEDVCRR